MSTAQIIYEQYKVLPKRIRKELKALIIDEEEAEKPMTLMEELEQSLKEVKLMHEGKIPSQTFEDLKREMREDDKQG